ncbi:hypothetical protein NG895_19465 [Aeoliella sp. ICT_H6.2]|uniref:Uncharacterized protein n=1 Tax=Aeoliella straminimaris TaxID=2954799 RepID=A0A9X2FBX6_9BACT|nr:hypothetical protein [Aeoliella straminimaris]MCO6046085.1 hypothetical protein [Aeoliella straminimaris]
MSRTRQFIASLLVLTYGLVAVGGHGLHALLPCGDPECVTESTTDSCSCVLCHHVPEATPADGADTDGPAFGSPDSGNHNPNTCVVCALLAKVKVGGATGPMVLELCNHSTAEKSLYTSTPSSTLLLIHAPRGPPAADCQV